MMEKLEDKLTEITKKRLIYKELVRLFFLYHDIKIETINIDFPNGHTIYSYDKIPPELNTKFQEKFELKMELEGVIHCEDGSYVYNWRVPKTWAQRRMDLWFDSLIPIIVPEPIMYIPDEERGRNDEK